MYYLITDKHSSYAIVNPSLKHCTEWLPIDEVIDPSNMIRDEYCYDEFNWTLDKTNNPKILEGYYIEILLTREAPITKDDVLEFMI